MRVLCVFSASWSLSETSTNNDPNRPNPPTAIGNTEVSYSIHDLRRRVRKPNGDQWSMGAIEKSVKALNGVVKDGNLYTIEP
jgi:hypothetical protein